MANILNIVNNRTLDRKQFDLSLEYPDSRFHLSSGVTPSIQVKEFVENDLTFEPSGRVHTKDLYDAFTVKYGTCVKTNTLASQLREMLLERDVVKTVVAINNVRAQGYKGVRLS